MTSGSDGVGVRGVFRSVLAVGVLLVAAACGPDEPELPLRQENVLWFYGTELVDLEVTVRSLVTATSLIPLS